MTTIMNSSDTLQVDRMNRGVSEMTKLVKGDAKERLSFNSDYSYADMKKIIEKMVNSKELLSQSTIQMLLMNMNMMPQQVAPQVF